MALRGLREKILYVHNPLPPITDAELLKRAELDYVTAADAPFGAFLALPARLERVLGSIAAVLGS